MIHAITVRGRDAFIQAEIRDLSFENIKTFENHRPRLSVKEQRVLVILSEAGGQKTCSKPGQTITWEIPYPSTKSNNIIYENRISSDAFGEFEKLISDEVIFDKEIKELIKKYTNGTIDYFK